MKSNKVLSPAGQAPVYSVGGLNGGMPFLQGLKLPPCVDPETISVSSKVKVMTPVDVQEKFSMPESHNNDANSNSYLQSVAIGIYKPQLPTSVEDSGSCVPLEPSQILDDDPNTLLNDIDEVLKKEETFETCIDTTESPVAQTEVLDAGEFLAIRERNTKDVDKEAFCSPEVPREESCPELGINVRNGLSPQENLADYNIQLRTESTQEKTISLFDLLRHLQFRKQQVERKREQHYIPGCSKRKMGTPEGNTHLNLLGNSQPEIKCSSVAVSRKRMLPPEEVSHVNKKVMRPEQPIMRSMVNLLDMINDPNVSFHDVNKKCQEYENSSDQEPCFRPDVMDGDNFQQIHDKLTPTPTEKRCDEYGIHMRDGEPSPKEDCSLYNIKINCADVGLNGQSSTDQYGECSRESPYNSLRDRPAGPCQNGIRFGTEQECRAMLATEMLPSEHERGIFINAVARQPNCVRDNMIPDSCNVHMKELLFRMLDGRPERRITPDEALKEIQLQDNNATTTGIPLSGTVEGIAIEDEDKNLTVTNRRSENAASCMTGNIPYLQELM